MLVYKAKQVIAVTEKPAKDWEMGGRKGTTFSAVVCCLGGDGNAENITLKAKTAEELKQKVARYEVAKAADIPIKEIVPVFKSGDRKPSGYELAG